MSTDNGNGMKIVGAVVLLSMALFMAALVAVWVGDTKMDPPADSASYPASRTE
ncbi:MAG: hypothetical protein ABI791_03100 [Acidobacteriota bacterium]